MFWSFILMYLNPALLLFGFVFIGVWIYVNLQESPQTHIVESDDDDEDNYDGGETIDWDAPLDLPPGIYVLPNEPVASPV